MKACEWVKFISRLEIHEAFCAWNILSSNDDIVEKEKRGRERERERAREKCDWSMDMEDSDPLITICAFTIQMIFFAFYP